MLGHRLIGPTRALPAILFMLLIELRSVQRKYRTASVLLNLLLHLDVAAVAISCVTEKVILHVATARVLSNGVRGLFLYNIRSTSLRVTLTDEFAEAIRSTLESQLLPLLEHDRNERLLGLSDILDGTHSLH